MLEVYETLHAQAYGFPFLVQCAWNSLVWMLCAESMGLLLRWAGLHGIRCKVISTWHFEFNFFCINEYADTDNSDDTGIINVHRYFRYICNCWEEMTSCADPHNGFADDVDTYTMHCVACWMLT